MAKPTGQVMGRVVVLVVVVLLLVKTNVSGSNLEESFKREISTSHKVRWEPLSFCFKRRDPTSKKVFNAKSS